MEIKQLLRTRTRAMMLLLMTLIMSLGNVWAEGERSVPTGAIDGVFTVSSTGDQVYFSKGNLQYQASTNTWRFAEHQYDYIGSANSNISSTYSGWIDLFGWGTSGYNHGAVCYQPWSVSSTSSSYYAYGNSQKNLYDETGEADWGYNRIVNGGDVEGMWKTLSNDEWRHIIQIRSTITGIRYAKAQVNSVNGVILVPDNWDSSLYELNQTNSSGASYSSNVITLSNWTNILEINGCVFIPAAGSRRGTSLLNINSHGDYWTSSYGDNSNTAFDMVFDGPGLFTDNIGDRREYGFTVRLVCPVDVIQLSLTIRTKSATSVTINSASCGGDISTDGSIEVVSRGICYSISENPTLDDSVVDGGSGVGSFTCTITELTPSTTYCVRAYASDGDSIYYGQQQTFTTRAEGLLEGALNGLFTINEDGDEVVFSQGNLQYQASTNTWKFAENQYDYVGSGNSNMSSTYSGWIDLFGWGTSGYNHGSNCYQPWSTSQTNSDYYAYGSSSYNLSDQDGTADWGHNPITNGGNQENLWHSLTNTEWSYLLFSRITASGIRFAKAQVNGINGVMLLPDNWNSSIYSLTNVNDSYAEYNSNVVDASIWNNTLAANDVVFLPAAGYRRGSTVNSINADGNYWTTSYYNNNSAYYVCFGVELYMRSDYRSLGESVRLVCSPSEFQPGLKVSTNSVNNRTTTTAECGGKVTSHGGLEVVSRGICYSISENPTLDDSVVDGGSGVGSFTCTITELTPSTKYYVRAYASDGDSTYYGNQQTFTTRMAGIPEGALNGHFTINEDGDEVFFSQGNLQYQASSNTWKFAENQYDYIGAANSNISSTYSGWIDLFGWGTSGYNHGAVCYQPWSTSTTYSYYYAYDNQNYNLYDQTCQADWGYNSILNGGNQISQWCTLRMREWDYVFNNRSTSSGIRYAKATVSGIGGIILVPDNWSNSTYALNSTNSENASFSNNIISQSVWESTLEPVGCVFLPAAGYRNAISVGNVGRGGYYWASSFYDEEHADNEYFYDNSLPFLNYDNRYYGYSVRLVYSLSDSLLEVSTAPVINRAATSAECGGRVTSHGGLEVVSRGICYSISENPTLDDSVVDVGNGTGSFTCTITELTPSTTYYVRAYASDGDSIYYGKQQTFTTRIVGLPQGTLNGYFSINTNGDEVVFSQGNLQYQASTNTWRFAENQYDYVGSTNSNISSTYSGWIDLFGWGTSGYNHRANCYQPWSTSQTDSYYYAYDQINSNLFDGNGKADWGYNRIENGGNQENHWHTLQVVEWEHLFLYRSTSSGIRYAKAQVNGINGVILVPDNWNSNIYTLSNTNSSGASFNSNVINSTTWSNVLEANGCVFLPAAGGRSGTSVENVGSSGHYWSSSRDRDQYSWRVAFSNSSLDPWPWFSTRSYGVSVRLVRSADELVSALTITTKSATSVTINSASCGGDITADEGVDITARGVCWSTSQNPTIEDSHTSDGTGAGSFTSNITGLTANTTYYVRAYATTNNETVYGNEVSFATDSAPAIPEGALPGLFTINSSNAKVYFSQGNLQYQASTNTWRFAENQYDCIGSANSNISSTYSGWIDLFGWGTSGYNHGAVSYQPWSTDIYHADYHAYGNYDRNLDYGSGQADWGYNAISNGGNKEHLWRSGTIEEWRYLLTERTTQSGIRYAHAQVNGVNGLILLPDDWNPEIYSLNNTNGDEASFNSNIIDSSTWQDIFQTNGAVFLPSGGFRDGSTVYNVGVEGPCWTSTFFDYFRGYNVGFHDNSIETNGQNGRSRAMSVRLIREYEGSINLSVTTSSVTNITQTSATCGGTINTDVLSRGICWSISENPTIDDSFVDGGNGAGNFICSITGLTPSTTYYVRAYASYGDSIYYGNQQTFTTCSNSLPAGALHGKFTINNSGDQVYFSQGNLQYIGSASTPYWKFAENQLEYLGDNGQGSSDPNVDRDLFGWGASGFNHGAVCYQPWSSSKTNSDYYAYGSSTANLFDQTGKADWGYNKIQNGGNQEHLWRTLTGGYYGEWWYICYVRSTPSGIRYAKACVNGVNGVILVPDDWNTSCYSFNNANTYTASFNTNIISISTWTNILEYNGCVFLPAAGMREGTVVSAQGECGLYNSSSYNNDNRAYYFWYCDADFYPDAFDIRYTARSVRLVCSTDLIVSSLTVTTNQASDITVNSASCGGNVVSDGSIQVTARGLCWSISENPTLDDNVVDGGSGVGSFTCSITGLTPSTIYYVRAYASDGDSTYYGNQQRFTTHTVGLPQGALRGRFTINNNGDQVYFSQGNLQYIGSASTPYWKFADHQWDYLGKNGQGSTNQYVDRDLFGWGTSGWNNGNTYYQPYHTANTYWNLYGPPGNYNMTGQYANSDWGVYNPITNGGNQAGMWRLLTGGTNGEWNFILNSRTTPSGIRYAKATVNNICGLILVPDGWNSNMYVLNNPNNPSAPFTSNIFDITTWLSLLEANGCVFLPAAGNRAGTYDASYNTRGAYWSSTYSNTSNAYYIQFENDTFDPALPYHRCDGRSVRLVCEAEEVSSVTIDASANPSQGGTVTGSGIYTQGASVTVTALPSNDFIFINWTENDEVVCTDAEYTFTAMDSRILVAHFQEIADYHWIPEISQFASYMNVLCVVNIDEVEQQRTDLELGAFCGEQCRGTKFAQQFPVTGRYIFRLAVYGDADDHITFRLYDHQQHTELALQSLTALDWNINGYGSLGTPEVLYFVSGVAIQASANPEEAGSINGTGYYAPGYNLTLTAQPNEGYAFVNWTENNIEVSTNASYSFTVEEARELVANFNHKQTLTLANGFNWISTYIEMNEADGLGMLEQDLGNNGEVIQNRLGLSVFYYDGYGWWGDLESITNEQMYQVKTTSACDLALTGELADVENHPVTINSGWNWIGYPLNYDMSAADALSSLSAETNDIIKSRYGFSIYYDGFGWYGDVETMEPGQGYMYKQTADDPQVLTYQPSTRIASPVHSPNNDKYYSTDAYAYSSNMSVIGVVELNGEEIHSEDYELAAFVNGECRGSVRLLDVESLNSSLALLTIQGEDHDFVTYRLYNHLTGIAYESDPDDHTNFMKDLVAGSLESPVKIHFSQVIENQVSLNVHPNPIHRDSPFTLILSGITEESRVTIEIYNAFGQKVREFTTAQAHIEMEGLNASGFYLIKAVSDSKDVICGKIIVE